jgi:uncharacterized membrane protein required for colicin V production
MLLPDSAILWVNALVIGITLICIIIGISKGFLIQLMELLATLVAFVVAVLFAPILGKYITLFKVEFELIKDPILIRLLNNQVNTVLWFVILFILLLIIFMILKPIIKTLGQLPVIRYLNGFLGGCLGLVKAAIYLLLISVILANAFFVNGYEFKNRTLLKQFDVLAGRVTSVATKLIEESSIIQRFFASPKTITEEQLVIVRKWLADNGLSAEGIESIIKSVIGEE